MFGDTAYTYHVLARLFIYIDIYILFLMVLYKAACCPISSPSPATHIHVYLVHVWHTLYP